VLLRHHEGLSVGKVVQLQSAVRAHKIWRGRGGEMGGVKLVPSWTSPDTTKEPRGLLGAAWTIAPID